jgi:hypothetical protein
MEERGIGHLSLCGSVVQREGREAPDRAQRPFPLHGGGAEPGVDGRRQIAEAAVRSDGIVVVCPGGESLAGMIERYEQGLVQQFVAQPSIEGFDEGVLLRLARGDVVPADAGLLAPP